MILSWGLLVYTENRGNLLFGGGREHFGVWANFKNHEVAYIINAYASYFLYSLLVISSLSLGMLCFEFRKSAFY